MYRNAVDIDIAPDDLSVIPLGAGKKLEMEHLYQMEVTEQESLSSRMAIEDSLRGLRVFEINPKNDPRWESFVASHPEGDIYHHPAWLEVLEREYQQKALHLACENSSGELLAIFPMLYTRGLPWGLGGPLSGRRLSSLPRTQLAGPLFKDRRGGAAVIQAAIERVQSEPGIRMQIKTPGEGLDGLAEGLTATPWRMSYVLRLPDLAKGPFRVKDSHDRNSIKWAINKATRLGVRVRPAENETDLRAWYALYLEAMRRNMVPARPYRFFAGLWDLMHARGMMQLLLAEKQEGDLTTMIAGSIFLFYGKTVSYVFNGSSSKDFSLRPNDMIQWEAINQAHKKGFELFDFGEVPEGNAALAKFKSKWGAEPTRLHRYYFPAAEPPKTATVDSEGRARQLAKAIWGRLPLRATAWLGDRLYSYL